MVDIYGMVQYTEAPAWRINTSVSLPCWCSQDFFMMSVLWSIAESTSTRLPWCKIKPWQWNFTHFMHDFPMKHRHLGISRLAIFFIARGQLRYFGRWGDACFLSWMLDANFLEPETRPPSWLSAEKKVCLDPRKQSSDVQILLLYWIILDDIGWYWMILDDIGWYWMILDDIGWYWMILDVRW